MPVAGEAQLLTDLGPGTPVLNVVRTAYNEAGRPVEVNEMTMDASAYVLQYNFDA
jgi:GntR family transcriptional regulator